MNDLGCKRLAAAVLRKAASDVRSENTDLSEKAKIEIEAGGCDLFLALNKFCENWLTHCES
jgi:hypothetical protein